MHCQIHYRKFHQIQLNYYKVVKHWQPLRRVPGGGIGNPAPRQSSLGEAKLLGWAVEHKMEEMPSKPAKLI